MSAWWWLVLVGALVLHTMVLPIVRELRKAREQRKLRPPGYKPTLRPPEDFDDDRP